MALNSFARRAFLLKVLTLLLAFTMIFNAFFVPKTYAFFPAVVFGGIALGEALFYTAGIAASGVALYEAYDYFTGDSESAQFYRAGAKTVWDKLSTTAKEGWAELEAAVVAGADKVTLTATQWMDAMKAGLASWGTTTTKVPAIPMPGDSFSVVKYVDNDFFVKYALLTFSMNGEQFALMPQSVYKNGSISYTWYYYHAKDGVWQVNYVPSSASAFIPVSFRIDVNPNYTTGLDYIAMTGSRITYLKYNAADWGTALGMTLDANAIIHGIMQSVYGGLAVSVPAGVGGLARPIPQEKDLTKPIAIPVPPGAITYPNTGTADLTLTPEMIKDMVGDMTGDITVPGNPGAPDWETMPKTKIDFRPLQIAGTAFTQKFPFSIPWDIKNQFSVFNVDPQTPILKVDDHIKVFGTTMDLKFDINFSPFNPVMVIVRWFMIIAFDLGMILSIRRFMPE